MLELIWYDQFFFKQHNVLFKGRNLELTGMTASAVNMKIILTMKARFGWDWGKVSNFVILTWNVYMLELFFHDHFSIHWPSKYNELSFEHTSLAVLPLDFTWNANILFSKIILSQCKGGWRGFPSLYACMLELFSIRYFPQQGCLYWARNSDY